MNLKALIELLLTLLSNPQIIELIKILIDLFTKVNKILEMPEVKAALLAAKTPPPA